MLVKTVDTEMGKGLVASAAIAAGAIIGRITGTVLTDPEEAPDYAIEVDGVRYLDPEPPFRFTNHSCEPNAMIAVYDEDVDEVYLEATRSIAPGEPVCIDYAWPAEYAIPCLCRSRACRGWIVDADELESLAV